jgi:hypothetical protein
MVQGPPEAPSVYLSKLSSILVGIQTIVRLLLLDIHYGLLTGGVTLACDKLSVLQKAFYDGRAILMWAQFDLIHII